jgi:predicted lactoylglutathione lyase
MNLDSPAQVDEALSTATAAGGKVLKPGRKTDWGYQGYFADPDGHIWEVVYNPGFPIGADGRPTLP